MRWPWQKRETRSTYTDAIIAALVGRASGDDANASATAALEACSGFVGRAFAAAEVSGPDYARAVLDPACLGLIGRSLIRRGEIVFLIRVQGGSLRLLPASSHDVRGDPDPSTWDYRVNLAGPESQYTLDRARSEGVVHCRYAFDVDAPWKGHGPIQIAALAGKLSAETAAALADESSGPRGSFLPTPVDGHDDTVTSLKADIRTAAGKMLITESGDWESADPGKMTPWEQKRFGASPPAALTALLKQSSHEVMAACGLTPALFDESDGTSKREGYRQALHSVVAPLGRMVADELSRKLEAEIRLDWTELRAADIAGRARAFQSLVGGGMDVATAAAQSGLMIADT